MWHVQGQGWWGGGWCRWWLVHVAYLRKHSFKIIHKAVDQKRQKKENTKDKHIWRWMWLLRFVEESKKLVQFAAIMEAFPWRCWLRRSSPQMWMKLFGGVLEGLCNSPFPSSFFYSICDCTLCEINILHPLFQFWSLLISDNWSIVASKTSSLWYEISSSATQSLEFN